MRSGSLLCVAVLFAGCIDVTCDGARCVPSRRGEWCADESVIVTPATCELGTFCDSNYRCSPLGGAGQCR